MIYSSCSHNKEPYIGENICFYCYSLILCPTDNSNSVLASKPALSFNLSMNPSMNNPSPQ